MNHYTKEITKQENKQFMTKKWFYIEYWDRFYTKIHYKSIKAKSKEQAEEKFYSKNPYTLIRKITLID